jgi:DNA modification methylase
MTRIKPFYCNDWGALYVGDCKETMPELPSDSVDLCVTDPPYGYSFMGKKWDIDVPSVEIWQELLRVLKPGAFAFIMSAPRQDVLSKMINNVAVAGFEVSFTPMYWAYASGFPKALNMSKAVVNRLGFERERVESTGALHLTNNPYSLSFKKKSDGTMQNNLPISTEAAALNGSYAGFQPKPAVEVIIVAMKPLSEKTYVGQALKNGKGVTWLDDCRVPVVGEDISGPSSVPNFNQYGYTPGIGLTYDRRNYVQADKRFPANLLVSDSVLDNGEISKSQRTKTTDGFGATKNTFGTGATVDYERGFADCGGFSRHFSVDLWWEEAAQNLPLPVQETFPFMIVPKPANSEKNLGCEKLAPQKWKEDSKANVPQDRSGNDRQNHHPTVKPLKLFSYLITLGSRKGDTIIDPFIGSGTAAIAAELMERKWIGCELMEEYAKTATARITAPRHKMKKLSTVQEINELKSTESQMSLSAFV